MANIINGTDNGESLSGTAGDDEIYAYGGSDSIGVTRGHDKVDGGAGYDLLHLAASTVGLGPGPRSYTITVDRLTDLSGVIDTQFTGIESLQLDDNLAGDVTLDASGYVGEWLTVGVQAGMHNLLGSGARDTFTVSGGSGTLDGGGGADSLAFNVDTGANTAAVVASVAGGAIVLAQAGGPSLTVRNIEQIGFGAFGGGALNVDASALGIALNFRQTTLADRFIGGSGNDSMVASMSETGAGDVFTGGGGADTYTFLTFAAFAGATITDLSEQDLISLSSTPGAMRFIGTAAFSGTAGEVRYVRGGTQTLLIGDADGDGVGESTLTLAGSFQIGADFTRTWDLRRIADTITGTAGNDTIKADAGIQTILALGGDDNIDLNRGTFSVSGGEGYDRLHVHSYPLSLPPGPHRYTITDGTIADDKGRLSATMSSIEMLFLTDVSNGDVTIEASTVSTMALNLTLFPGTHDVRSGAGADQISVRGGSGSYNGGSGDDWLWVEFDNSTDANLIRATEANGAVTLTQAGRADLIARNFETLDLQAQGGALRIDASAISQGLWLHTTAFADTIIGSNSDDTFYSSFHSAGTGDVLTGGGGSDTYNFYSFSELNGTTITDLAGLDGIHLHGISGARFIGTAAFSGAAGEIRYAISGGQTLLIGDADGDGVGESVLTLSGRGVALRETAPGNLYLQTATTKTLGSQMADTLFGSTQADEILALAGDDIIKVSRGADWVDGGLGRDALELDAALLAFGTGPRSYTVTNTLLADGSGAVDTRFASIERLRITDVAGSNVTVDASALTGIPLIVTVAGGTHSLTGGSGNDAFSVSGGSGAVDGGGGMDSLLFVTSQNGNPMVVSQSGGAAVFTQAGGPNLVVRNIESILVSAASGNPLWIDASANATAMTFVLTGMADRVTGGAAAEIFSVAGPATGMGDELTGGGGADIFSFASFAAYSGAVITDLDADDIVRIPGTPATAYFIGGRDFTGAAGETRYLSGSGLTALLTDIDGDGEADSAMLITNGAFVLAETGTLGDLRIVGEMPANDEGANVMIGTDGADYLDSGAGDDEIDGRGGNDTINAGDGDDHVQGGGGTDTIHGDDGDDFVDGGADLDYLFGDDGDDLLVDAGISGGWMTGGLGNDRLTAAGGAFNMFGDGGGSTDEDGDDWLTLNSGASGSWLSGGGGNDVIRANGTGMVIVDGGTGDDDITIGGFTGGSIRLDAGNDTLRIANAGGFTLEMGESFGTGRDRVTVQSLSGFNTIIGMDAGARGDVLDLSAYGADPFGSGALTIEQSGANTIIRVIGTSATIVIQNMVAANLSAFNLGVTNPLFAPVGLTIEDAFGSSPAIDWPSQLTGADGNDTIRGFGGNDWLYGAGGNDRLEGGQGDDLLDGGSGDDLLLGGAGIDTASYAEAGTGVTVDLSVTTAQDTGGAGTDTLQGIENLAGSGFDDVLTGDGGANLLIGGEGQDWLNGGGGNDVETGGDGHDSVWGGDGDDWLDGGAGDDTLFGGTGIDTVSYARALAGVEIDLSWLEEQNTRGAGVDTLVAIENVIGSAFDDVLTGNAGANVLTGGGGNDRFVFGGSGPRDTITDFAAGDLIDLSAIDANGALAGDAAFGFIGAAAFGGVAGQLRVSGSGTSWLVEGDINGDRVADFSVLVMTPTPGLGLAASDFLL